MAVNVGWDMPYCRFLLRVRCHGQPSKTYSYGWEGCQYVYHQQQVVVTDVFAIRGWGFSDKGEKYLRLDPALATLVSELRPLDIDISKTGCLSPLPDIAIIYTFTDTAEDCSNWSAKPACDAWNAPTPTTLQPRGTVRVKPWDWPWNTAIGDSQSQTMGLAPAASDVPPPTTLLTPYVRIDGASWR